MLESDAITHFMRIKNEKLDFYAGGSGNMYFNYALKTSQESKSQFTNASGVGFYIENNTPGDIILGWQSKNSDGKQHICTGVVYCYDVNYGEGYLADTDDTWDVHCMPFIPAYFKGYIVFPFSSLSYRENGEWTDWSSNDYIDSLGLIVRGGVLNKDENMIIDNLFVYGENVDDNNNGRVYFGIHDGTEPEPSAPTQTEVATSVEPTNTSNANPTETISSEPGSSNNQTIIYVIIGVVVVLGIVAILFILKNNKNNNK